MGAYLIGLVPRTAPASGAAAGAPDPRNPSVAAVAAAASASAVAVPAQVVAALKRRPSTDYVTAAADVPAVVGASDNDSDSDHGNAATSAAAARASGYDIKL
jgi:hypothetical protein